MQANILIRNNPFGFTLLELVIVVLVLGIITAAAAPNLFITADDAAANATRQSLVSLRNSLEFHRAQNGAYPTVAGITSALAPFLQGPFPAPQVGQRKDPTVVGTTQNPITAIEAGTDGWVYNQTTGEIRINHHAYIGW